MLIESDDEVYRVNAVWLGPPKATMPQATYRTCQGMVAFGGPSHTALTR